MNDYKKYYAEKTTEELVEIVESDSSYELEVIKFCLELLKSRNITDEELKDLSAEVLHQRFFRYFSEGKYLTREIINIDSHFHEEEEVKEIFRDTQSYYIHNINSLTKDLGF
jgi:RecJ-like exonuclease